MAKVMAGIGTGLYGTIDELSFYKMKGVDKTIVRRKGGHTKKKVKRMPKVQIVLSEFSGRSRASKLLRDALGVLPWYAGRNLAGTINALMIPVQENDKVNRLGQRNIALSTCPHIVRGFSLSKTHLFDSVIRHPLQWSIQRETATATVHFPGLVPGLNFITEENYPYYRLVVSLGTMPDLFWSKSGYWPADLKTLWGGTSEYSDWYPLMEGSPAADLTVNLLNIPKVQEHSLILSVGVCYGKLIGTNKIDLTRDAGCSKILDVG